MDTNQNSTLTSEERIAMLEEQLAEHKAQLAERDEQLAAAHSEIDSLHADVEEKSLLNTNTPKIEAAEEEVAKLRDLIISWFIGGELSAAQRRRLFGSGIRRLGFIKKVAEVIQVNPELAPSFFDRAHFGNVMTRLDAAISLNATAQQLQRLTNDVLLLLGDEAYRMALIYYIAVRDAATRNVPGARELFGILQAFFRRGRRPGEEPTEEEVMRDADALLHGRKDGEVVIRNEKPHMTGGAHEVIDRTHKEKEAWKETEEGSEQ
jgi:hypothetical protein